MTARSREPKEEVRPGGDAGAASEPEIEILAFGDDEPAGAADAGAAEAGADLARREIEELKERNLRLLADLDNLRKRGEREREDLARYAAAETLRELIPVFDNFERAATAPGSEEDLRRGVAMVTKQLREALRRLGVSEIPAVGERFDPKVHEAVLGEETPGVEHPVVTAELQRGYRLQDRLLRPAMVKVAVPPETEAAEADAEPGDDPAANG